MSPARTPPQAPPNFGETPETLLQTAAHIQANYRDGLRELRQNIEPCCATFENLIQPLAALQNDYSWHFLQFYQCIPPNKELQEAATQASDLRCIMTDEIPDFSEHFKIINSKVEDLDVESQRLLHKILTDFAARPESDRVEEIDSLLGEIEGKIEAKLVNDGSGLWLRETQLEGVPRDVIDGLKKGDRKYFVEYDSPACRKIQQWAVSPKVRRTIYIMSQRRHVDKAALFQEAVVLRDERARLLGCNNHAEYQMKGNMIDKPEDAKGLLEKFEKRILRIGVLQSLIEAKRNDPQDSDKDFYFWDYLYYQRKWQDTAYAIDHTKISEYFPLKPTIRGIFSLFQTLFGIVFRNIDGTVTKDAELYSVWDNEELGGGFLGYLYLDMYARPGKLVGARNILLQPGFQPQGRDRTYTVCAISCDLQPPTATRPCLLEHESLKDIVHEIGHSMHAILSRTKYPQHSGFCGTRDLAEIPGILLENWCWEFEQLRELSGHFKTGQKMPDEMIKNLIRTRDLNEKLLDSFQVALASFDQLVYSPASHKEAKALNPPLLWHNLVSKIRGLKGTENKDWDHGYAGGSEIIEYPGSEIIYISSFCFAEHIWKYLRDNNAWMRWRQEVLEKGGSMEPMDVLEKLFGERPIIKDLMQ